MGFVIIQVNGHAVWLEGLLYGRFYPGPKRGKIMHVDQRLGDFGECI